MYIVSNSLPFVSISRPNLWLLLTSENFLTREVWSWIWISTRWEANKLDPYMSDHYTLTLAHVTPTCYIFDHYTSTPAHATSTYSTLHVDPCTCDPYIFDHYTMTPPHVTTLRPPLPLLLTTVHWLLYHWQLYHRPQHLIPTTLSPYIFQHTRPYK